MDLTGIWWAYAVEPKKQAVMWQRTGQTAIKRMVTPLIPKEDWTTSLRHYEPTSP